MIAVIYTNTLDKTRKLWYNTRGNHKARGNLQAVKFYVTGGMNTKQYPRRPPNFQEGVTQMLEQLIKLWEWTPCWLAKALLVLLLLYVLYLQFRLWIIQSHISYFQFLFTSNTSNSGSGCGTVLLLLLLLALLILFFQSRSLRLLSK